MQATLAFSARRLALPPTRDRLAVANEVLDFLCLPKLEARDLPPVRYRKQADSATEHYVNLVRSAMRP
jgi:hypothetical protein